MFIDIIRLDLNTTKLTFKILQIINLSHLKKIYID